MKLYLRTYIGDYKGYYYGTMLHPFQVLCYGNGGALARWFLTICNFILHLKGKGYGFEIKTVITGNEFKLVNILFVKDGYFWIQGRKPTVSGIRYKISLKIATSQN